MTKPCEIGLNCPYGGLSEDGMICSYPKLMKDVEEDELCSYVYDVDCEIMDSPSLLSDFILLKDCIERCSCPSEQKIEDEKFVKEWNEHCNKNARVANKKTEVVLYRRGITEDVCQNCGILEGEAEAVLDYLKAEAARVKLGDGEQ